MLALLNRAARQARAASAAALVCLVQEADEYMARTTGLLVLREVRVVRRCDHCHLALHSPPPNVCVRSPQVLLLDPDLLDCYILHRRVHVLACVVLLGPDSSSQELAMGTALLATMGSMTAGRDDVAARAYDKCMDVVWGSGMEGDEAEGAGARGRAGAGAGAGARAGAGAAAPPPSPPPPPPIAPLYA